MAIGQSLGLRNVRTMNELCAACAGDVRDRRAGPRRKRLNETAVRRSFPIADRVPGWFFRIREVSPHVWRGEGTDLWGRGIEQAGPDEETVLQRCAAAADELDRQLASDE